MASEEIDVYGRVGLHVTVDRKIEKGHGAESEEPHAEQDTFQYPHCAIITESLLHVKFIASDGITSSTP